MCGRSVLHTAAALAAFSLLAGCGGISHHVMPQTAGGAPGPNGRFFPAGHAAGAVDWSTFGFNRQRTSYNPSETVLTTGSVSKLQEKWTFGLGAADSDTQPLVAANVRLSNGSTTDIVYATDEASDVYAIQAQTGQLVWSRTLKTGPSCSKALLGITSTPAFDRTTNRLYVTDDSATLWALDLGTGKESAGFAPVVLFGNTNVNQVWSGLLLSADGKNVFYPTASHCDKGTYYGTINRIDTSTQVIKTYNAVVNKSKYYGNGIWSWGGEAQDPSTGYLYAGVGNAFGPNGENYPNSDSVVEVTPSMTFIADDQPEAITGQPDYDIGTTPIVYDDQGRCVAFERKDGNFFTVDRTKLANGAYGTKIALGGKLATPAYSPVTHALYAAVPNGLTRINVAANCTAAVAWQAPINATGKAVPVIANGVIYAAGGTTGSILYAVDAASGTILWNSGSAIAGPIVAAPTVANGMVYASAWDGRVYAFGL